MLRIYDVILQLIRDLRPLVEKIERHDRGLGIQIKNAMNSVALNTGEGMGSTRGTRRARYESALGSMRETYACLQSACAWGYLESVPPHVTERTDHVIGTMVRLVHPRR